MAPKNQPISGNDLARFSGPNTFMRLPAVNDLKGLDVCFLGVPID
ncbi:MAG: agmatinase, partial [Planctomycetota bacterium]